MPHPSPRGSDYWLFVIVTALILEFLFYSLFSNYITEFERMAADILLFGAVLLTANRLWPRLVGDELQPERPSR